MHVGWRRILFWLMGGILLHVVTGLAWAHRLDEYLQATLVGLSPQRVEINLSLTAGIAVVSNVVAVMDIDGNQVISPQEERAYGELVLGDLTASVDDARLALQVTGTKFPGMAEFREGLGSVQLKFEGSLPRLNPGVHQLKIENRHLPAMSQYLMNALVPESPMILIRHQERNEAQTRYTVTIEVKQKEQKEPNPRIARERAYLILGAVGVAAIVGGLGALRWIRGK